MEFSLKYFSLVLLRPQGYLESTESIGYNACHFLVIWEPVIIRSLLAVKGASQA